MDVQPSIYFISNATEFILDSSLGAMYNVLLHNQRCR